MTTKPRVPKPGEPAISGQTYVLASAPYPRLARIGGQLVYVKSKEEQDRLLSDIENAAKTAQLEKTAQAARAREAVKVQVALFKAGEKIQRARVAAHITDQQLERLFRTR